MSSASNAGNEAWVVGVDGSDVAEHALQWAVSQAETRRVSIEVVLVMSGAPGETGDALDAGQARLDDLRAHLGEVSTPIELRVASGGAAGALLEHAARRDLLILGTRGLGGFRGLLLGSVTHQCAIHASVPVIIVPPEATLGGHLEHVVVGMDASDNAKAALRWALRFASASTTIEIVGAWEPSVLATPADRVYFDDLAASTREAFELAIEEVTATVPTAATVSTSFHYAKPTDLLVDKGREAHLVVVGARGHGATGAAILGSVSNTLLHHTTCPVVVVPDTHAATPGVPAV